MRWIGYVILFYAVFQVGLKKVERLRHCGDILFDLWYAVGEIGRMISVSMVPLPAIYAELQKSGQGRTSFLERLHTTSSFQAAYGEIKQALPTSVSHTMEGFCRTLGKCEASEQIKLCRETAEVLWQTLQAEQGSFPQKKRMYLSVAACVGGMLILFML